MATILIVDSGNRGRRPLAERLGRDGHRVLECGSRDKAREIARAEKPDLVLTDVPLPDMGGKQLVVDAESGMPQTAVRERRGLQYFVREAPDALIGVIDAALAAIPAGDPEQSPAPAAGGERRKPQTSRLRRRLTDLEDLNLELSRQLDETRDQLSVARSALREEVEKRIWAETELTRANLQLRDRAVRDALTGVHNRGYLEESLAREEARARRNGLPLGVMMIDIDHFKRCNDTYGHAAGDAVLRAVGQYVMSLTRGEDIFCRYGGEEFVLIMIDTTARAVWERAEALRAGVEDLAIEHEGRALHVTLSIGVAMIPDHARDGRSALKAADGALYRAKQGGRNRVVASDAVPDETT
jgi:diguanylate cyclase (GGDEF)-like protein